jgi:hypothetical protein
MRAPLVVPSARRAAQIADVLAHPAVSLNPAKPAAMGPHPLPNPKGSRDDRDAYALARDSYGRAWTFPDSHPYDFQAPPLASMTAAQRDRELARHVARWKIGGHEGLTDSERETMAEGVAA